MLPVGRREDAARTTRHGVGQIHEALPFLNHLSCHLDRGKVSVVARGNRHGCARHLSYGFLAKPDYFPRALDGRGNRVLRAATTNLGTSLDRQHSGRKYCRFPGIVPRPIFRPKDAGPMRIAASPDPPNRQLRREEKKHLTAGD